MSESVFKKHLPVRQPISAVRLTSENWEDVKKEVGEHCIEVDEDNGEKGRFLEFTIKNMFIVDSFVQRVKVGDWVIDNKDGTFNCDFDETFRTRYQTEPSENQ